MIKEAATEEEPKGNIATRSYDKLQGKWSEIDPTLRKALAGGAGGAALGGGLGYLLTGDKAGESEEERRRRVIANALLGTALGGVAGSAIPAGVDMLQRGSQQSTDDKFEDILAQSAGAGIGAGAGLGVGGGALAYMANKGLPSQNKATQVLNDLVGDKSWGTNHANSRIGQRDAFSNILGKAMADRKIIRSQADVTDLLKQMRAAGMTTGTGLFDKLLGQKNLSKDITPTSMNLTTQKNLLQNFHRMQKAKNLGRGGLLGGLALGGGLLGNALTE